MTAGLARRVVPLDPDRSLVRAAQADPSTFDGLYRKYLAQVYNLAYHELGDHHEAEDVTEHTFMLALGALPRFRETAPDDAGPEASTFRVWLFRIARNVVANHRRAARRRPTEPLEAAANVASPDDVEGGAVARADASAAWAAVRRLPGDRRRAIVLRFVDEMSTAEIAGILERSEGAVRVLLHRALRSVARDLRADESSAVRADDASSGPFEASLEPRADKAPDPRTGEPSSDGATVADRDRR